MKERRKRTGAIVIGTGMILLLSAFLLFRHNRLEDVRAGQKSAYLLTEIEEVISDESAARLNNMNESASDTGADLLLHPAADGSGAADSVMPAVIVDGYGYIGYLGIPALGLELPVMSEWDYDRLNISPCRQFGSTRTDDIVIAAHNYKSHFGRLSELTVGDTVVFTDADGENNTYSVKKIGIVQPTDADSVKNSGFDMVLYTCTYSGKSRVAVYCSRVGDIDSDEK